MSKPEVVSKSNFKNLWIQINLLKRYFGEAEVFSYLFRVHYATFLFGPSLFGLLQVGIQFATDPGHQSSYPHFVDSWWNTAFSCFLLIWSSAMLESWRRREQVLV